jgi:hypothetical protein
MDGVAGDLPAPRAGWRRPRDDRRDAGADGPQAWLNGKAVVRAYVAIALLLLLVDAVNVSSVVYDWRRSGRTISVWEPLTWEYTSGAAEMLACGVILLALAWATPGRAPWRRVLPVHIAANLVFSGLHTGLMTLLRMGIYALVGKSYRAPPFGDWLYEYRKDLMAYVILGGVFWLFCRPRPAPAAPSAPPADGATFDIADGASVLRVRVREILGVRAAGNYVEFLLEDGRRPLMRTALATVEAKLAGCGFLRTHRSWLVNPARLTRLEALGSGDYRIVLGPGVEAALSRRFPEALERLRTP